MRCSSWISGCLITVGLVAGCPGDDPDEGVSTTASTEATGTSGDATMTASMSGSNGSASGPSSTDGGETSGGESSTTDTSSTQGTDEGTDTEVTDPCAGLDRAACTEAEECRPAACSEYVASDTAAMPWCLEAPAYIGCVPADLGCVEVRTVACQGDDGPTYVCPDGCLPSDFTECEPPVEGGVPPCADG